MSIENEVWKQIVVVVLPRLRHEKVSCQADRYSVWPMLLFEVSSGWFFAGRITNLRRHWTKNVEVLLPELPESVVWRRESRARQR